jgi:hypothetical protein
MISIIECPRRRRRVGTRVLIMGALSLGLWVAIGYGIWRFL